MAKGEGMPQRYSKRELTINRFSRDGEVLESTEQVSLSQTVEPEASSPWKGISTGLGRLAGH